MIQDIFVDLMVEALAEIRGRPSNYHLDEAKSFLEDFLKQSSIEFGDEGYDWTENGAYEIAREYADYD